MFSSSKAFTSPVSEAKLRCNQNHSRLQTGMEPEIALRALSHWRLGLQQLPLPSKELPCVVGDSDEALKHRVGEGALLLAKEGFRAEGSPFTSPWVQGLARVSHFSCSSALSGVICVKSVIGPFHGRLLDRSQEARKHPPSAGCYFHMAQPCLVHLASANCALMPIRPC